MISSGWAKLPGGVNKARRQAERGRREARLPIAQFIAEARRRSGRGLRAHTISRNVLCPTSIPALTATAGKVSRYSGNPILAKRQPRCPAAQIIGEEPGLARQYLAPPENPQWPMISVVTPWRQFAFGLGVDRQDEIGMGFLISMKPWRHGQPLGVDTVPHRAARSRPEPGDMAGVDREHRHTPPGRRAASDHRAAANEMSQVMRSSLSSRAKAGTHPKPRTMLPQKGPRKHHKISCRIDELRPRGGMGPGFRREDGFWKRRERNEAVLRLGVAPMRDRAGGIARENSLAVKTATVS